jgi:hypothetical protein
MQNQRIIITLSIALAVGPHALAQQAADPNFKPAVDDPAYRKSHPRVLIDEAHHNFHTSTGRYKPFADLLTADGCRVSPNKAPFTAESLRECDVLVIANALGDARMGTQRAEAPAFDEAECDAVRDWVKSGGALLLITDHYPTGSAAEPLAQRFDVDCSKGATEEYQYTPETGLGDHAIVRGRSEAERVRKVATFTGQSLQGPPDSVALLKLPDDAKEKIPDPANPFRNKPLTRSARGRCQAVAMTFGKGRMVMLGEAAMLTAQIGPDGRPFGMNVPGVDNRQFALNVVHWLTGLLEPRS